MNDALSLAFYKAPCTCIDKAIRLATRSRFSHVELVVGQDLTPHRSREAWSISSSSRDGGVREKRIIFKSGKWEFVPIQGWARADAWVRACSELGHGYDYLGIVFNFPIPINIHAKQRWFCSELCGYALGIDAPHTLSPGGLFQRVSDKNRVF